MFVYRTGFPAIVLTLHVCCAAASAAVADEQDITAQAAIAISEADRATPPVDEFKPLGAQELRLPYSGKRLWIKIRLENPAPVDAKKVLYFTAPLTGVVRLYPEAAEPVVSGSSIPLVKRALASRLTAFPITVPAGAGRTFYLSRDSHHSLATHIMVADPEVFQRFDNEGMILLAFYLGGIVCLALYNIFVGLYARDLNFLLYAVFAVCFAAAVSCLNGADSVIFRNWGIAPSHHLMALTSLTLISALTFVYRFLAIKIHLRRVRIVFFFLGGLAFVTFFAGLTTGPYLPPLGYLIDVNAVVTTAFLIGCAAAVYVNGFVLAKFFLLSWLAVLVSVIVWYGMMLGWLPHLFLTQNALLMGNLGEMLIISLGLAYKINILDQKARTAEIEGREKERYHLLVKVLSHDIGHLLQVAELCILRLKDSIFGNEDREILNRLNGVIDRVRQTLGFVREEETLKASQKALKLAQVDLRTACLAARDFFADLLREKNLTVVVRVPPSCFVHANFDVLVNQVISNILSNAIKYSRPSGEISIEIAHAADFIRLTIRDNGIGMRPDHLQKAFFSREIISTRGTSSEQGSGLGASLAQEYMKLFDGKIEVQSVHESESEQSGTTVCLCFPRLSGQGAFSGGSLRL